MSQNSFDGKALVYADQAFNTPNGKTAHGRPAFDTLAHGAAALTTLVKNYLK